MKKITLIIAFLAISIGTVWGEIFVALSGTTDNQYLPFDLNYAGNQHVQMIYPASLFHGEDANEQIYEMNFIQSFTFTASTNSFDNSAIIEEQTGTANGKNYKFKDDVSVTVTVAKISASTYTGTQFIDLTNCNCEKFVGDVTLGDGTLIVNVPSGNNQGRMTLSTSENLLFDFSVTVDPGLQETANVSSWSSAALTNLLQANLLQALYKHGDYEVIGVRDYLPQLTLGCSRKLKDLNYTHNKNQYVFDVFSLAEGFTSYAVLKKCTLDVQGGHVGEYYINPSNDFCNPTLTPSNAVAKYVFEIPSTLPCYLEDKKDPDNISLKKLSNDFNHNFAQISNSAIIFPATLESVGDDDNSSNTALSSINGSKGNVIIFDASNNNPPEFVGGTESQVDVSAVYYVFDNCTASLSSKNGWSSNGININAAWCSHPYKVTMQYAYSKQVEMNCSTDVSGIGAHYAKVINSPFNNSPLVVELKTDKRDANSDGTFHVYYKFTSEGCSANPSDGVDMSIEGEKTFKATFSSRTDFILSPRYYGELKAEDTSCKYKDNDGNISSGDLFKNRCDYVVFRYDDESKTPRWYYTGVSDEEDANNNKAIDVNTEIRVEKKIDNHDYHYFSLPFACQVSDIEVRYFSDGTNPTNPANNRNGEGTLELLTDNINNLGYLTKDYFIIQKYEGQSAELGEKAEYSQITNAGDWLEPYKGYAFAVVESNIHYNDGSPETVEAMIVFKSTDMNGAKNKFGSTTYDGFSISAIDYSVSDKSGISTLNRGWNMVGNPFYFPIKGAAYQYGDNQNKNFARIDNVNGGQYKVQHFNSLIEDSENSYIQPFETIFLQVPDQISSIGVNPNGQTVPLAQQMPARRFGINAIENKPEHISIKITDANGESDRTTVINMEGRDTSFVIGDDFAKMMNPGAQIYSWYSNVPCVFKELPLREDSSCVVPLGIIVPATGIYTFALDTSLTLFYGAAMLHDKQMNQYHPLNENGVQISLQKGTDNARFEVVIVPSEIPADVENVETSETLDAYVHDGRLVVENIEEGSTLSVFDVSGRMLYTAPAAGDFNYQFSAHGVYMVVLQGNTTGSIKVVY